MQPDKLWKSYRKWLIDDRPMEFRLDVSRMDLPSDLPERMSDAWNAARTAMEQLEAGAIANPDEDRMVGHYWLRNPDKAPTPEIRNAIVETLKAVTDFAAEVRGGKVRTSSGAAFRNLLVIGIGGSALGPQFVAEALSSAEDPLKPWFFDNTDPDGIDRTLAGLGKELGQTLCVIISKSGGTPETRNGMLEARAAFERIGVPFGPHAVAITQEGSKLDRFAVEDGFLRRFPMWDWVGGRTSETSAVGLLPAALQGLDIHGMLRGAKEMDESTRNPEARRNPAAMLAMAWHHATDGVGAKDMVVLPYRDRLLLISRYLQQLVMESLGKEKDLDGKVVHQGLAVYGNKGSTDQHAYVQQLREGVPNFFANFIEVLHDRDRPGLELEPGVRAGDFLQGFLLGTRRALYENGRRSMTITIDRIDAAAIGRLIALYERAVGFYATMIHVNAYHQPGVEAGKKAAAGVLEVQRKALEALAGLGSEGGTADKIAAEAGMNDQAETVFMILERLASNSGRGVSRLPGDAPWDSVFRTVPEVD